MAIDCLKFASTGRKQGRQEVAIVAEEFDNHVGDGDIVSTRVDARGEVVALNVGVGFKAQAGQSVDR